MNETAAFDFLLYSYFKVSTESPNADVMDSAIKEAYNDAVRQGAFNTLVSDESKELLPQIKQTAFLKMQQILEEYLQTGKFENNWHKEWCDELVQIFASIKSHKGETAFTYGNAQKWVNMTLKNLYIMAIAFKSSKESTSKEWYDIIIDNANCFHIPLDSYILKAAFSDFETMKSHIKVRGKKNLEYRIMADEKEYCWSKISTYQIYLDFQNALITAIKEKYAQCPLDWECKAWVEVAKNK